MIYRLWDFCKRHKKKLLGTAVVVGGGYVAYQAIKPRLQEYFLKRLLQQMEQGDLLKEILGGVEDPEQQKANKRAKFEHNQQVADRETRKGLLALNERLIAYFKVDAKRVELQAATDKAAKVKALTELQLECLARTMSGLYTMHLLLLLHRVEFNIVGREMSASSSKSGEDHSLYTAFVDISDAYVSGEGLQHICNVMREAVKARWAADSLQPTTKVSPETFTSFLTNACRAADAELLESGKGPAMLLPESLDASADPKVKKLLDEVRDYLESPHFLTVFRSIVDGGIKHFVESLGESHEESRAAPLPCGTPTAIAKIGGDCVTRSQAMLANDDGADVVRRFANDPLVTKLCEALYFEEATP